MSQTWVLLLIPVAAIALILFYFDIFDWNFAALRNRKGSPNSGSVIGDAGGGFGSSNNSSGGSWSFSGGADSSAGDSGGGDGGGGGGGD